MSEYFIFEKGVEVLEEEGEIDTKEFIKKLKDTLEEKDYLVIESKKFFVELTKTHVQEVYLFDIYKELDKGVYVKFYTLVIFDKKVPELKKEEKVEEMEFVELTPVGISSMKTIVKFISVTGFFLPQYIYGDATIIDRLFNKLFVFVKKYSKTVEYREKAKNLIEETKKIIEDIYYSVK